MNNVNNDIDQSKDIYSCFQADKYMYKPIDNFIKSFQGTCTR